MLAENSILYSLGRQNLVYCPTDLCASEDAQVLTRFSEREKEKGEEREGNEREGEREGERWQEWDRVRPGVVYREDDVFLTD